MIATKDLAPIGKVRICAEIEAHFADGVESHLAEGHLLEQARQAVLDELGDPSSAAKRFRKLHLTVKEASFIRIFISRLSASRLVALLIINSLLALSFFVSTPWFHHPSLVRIMLLTTVALKAILLIAIASFIARHRTTAQTIHLSFVVELIDQISALMCLPWCLFEFHGLGMKLLFGFAGVMVCREFWRTSSLWLKIRGLCDPAGEAGSGAGLAASRAGIV